MKDLNEIKAALQQYEYYRGQPTEQFKEAREIRAAGDIGLYEEIRLSVLRKEIEEWTQKRAQALAALQQLHDAPVCIITEKIATAIRERTAQGFSNQQTAWMFGVSDGTVSMIKNGKYRISKSDNLKIGTRGHRKPDLKAR